MTPERIILLLLMFCLPMAAWLYGALVGRLRRYESAVLEGIDPRGFRALNASSQLRLAAFVHRGGYRELGDPGARRLAAGFRWLLYGYVLGWIVLAVLVFR